MDKRTIIALIVIGIIILFYDDYLRLLYPPPPETSEAPADTLTPPRQTITPSTRPTPGIGRGDFEGETTLVKETGEGFVAPDSLPERFITVETDRFRARFSSHGARLVSLTLKPNGRYLKKDIELLSRGENSHLGFRFWTVDGPLETSGLNFRLVGGDDHSDRVISLSGNQSRNVEFQARLGPELTLSVTYSFNGSGYSFIYTVRGEGTENFWVRDYGEVFWSGGLAFTEADTGQDGYYSKAYTFYSGNVLENLKLNGKKAQTVGPSTGDTRWGAVRTKYFLMALIPETALAVGAWMENQLDSSYVGNNPPNRLGVGLRIPVQGGSPVTPITVFIGPLDVSILSKVDPSLKRTMSWGWAIIAPFSKVILWGLKKLGDIIPNYGICIIIFSVLIKVIIWPLTRKSYQSMAAMQQLQPKIKAMREKFKNDQQRMQKELMKLYKEEKINPMGGCLPVLLQMPLLWALFIVFRSTIEFRRAPFVFWIDDLSMPDIILHLPFTIPIYGSYVALLPILMGISTFLQSKSTMTDPNQKMMLYFMPIFMTLIFNQFPSGLTLYYTLFNIWTMLQQRITPPPRLATATEPEDGNKSQRR